MAVAQGDVDTAVAQIADEWRAARSERQARRELDKDDFDRLRSAGFLHTAVPREMGGLWRSVGESTRSVCALLRTLARGDPSVALVSAMHPAVIGFWLAPTPAGGAALSEQRTALCALAAEGRQ